MNFIAFHCGQTQHSFARNGEDELNAYHSDGAICTTAEFNLADLLNDGLPRAMECPWCMTTVFDTEHMRGCSGYSTPATREEICDAYSHPTEQAKRDSLLAGIDG